LKTKNETDTLNEEINLLIIKQSNELKVLREQLNITYESINPINLIKSTFLEATASPEVKNSIVNNTIGIAAGYLSKKVLFGASHNPVKRFIGTLFQFVIANVVSKNSDRIKLMGESALHHFLENKNKNQ